MTPDPLINNLQNHKIPKRLTGLDAPEKYSSWRIRDTLIKKTVTDAERWRLGMLVELIRVTGRTGTMRSKTAREVLDC